MSAPLFANLFHGHFRRKESERQASFFLRVTFTILFHAKSGGDIHTFDGFPCEALCLCDRRCGRGHSGQRFPSSVLLDRIARAASGQVARQCPRTSAICEDLRARHSGFYDLFVPLWSRHRHRVALSSQVGAYFDLDLGRPVGFFRCHWDPHCVSDAVSPTPNAPNLPAESMQAFRWIILIIYGVPLLIGIWWLILFNRKTVKAQFAGQGESADQGLPRKPACPLPISVLAWFYVASVLNLVFLPLLPFHIPLFVFGYVLPGSAGRIALIITSLAFAVAGVGLLKLKPWSYSLTIGLQLFWLASGVVSALTPNYGAVMDSYMKEVQ